MTRYQAPRIKHPPVTRIKGTLFVVATPLGNLGDITLRASEVLRTVACVAAEDTRHTRQLLHHLEAHPRLISLHEHSPETRFKEIVGLLDTGRDVALVSDAGTPVVSDPGADLVAFARSAGFDVVPIPGVSAVTAALSASGLVGDRYVFLGFLPRKGKERRTLLERAGDERMTVIFYEAPTRLVALLNDLGETAGSARQAVVARELTKLHEEIRVGTLAELAAHFAAEAPRGEITVLLTGATANNAPPPETGDLDSRAGELLKNGMSRKAVVQALVQEFGWARNEVYRRVMEIRS